MRSRRPIARRTGSRGYTIVELMMAVALFAVGVLGIISMQKVTVVSNTHAKNVSVAQRIAQSWAAQLQLDATTWTTTLVGTSWLNLADTGWQRPAYVTARSFGAAFDALGNPLDASAAEQRRARYCTNIRLTRLYAENQAGVVGNGMMRAEIRVYWLRDGQADLAATGGNGLCVGTFTATDVDTASDRYHFIYHTAGVRQASL